MAFRNFTLLLLLCLLTSQVSYAQINSNYLMDSIEIEKGVPGTSDFEPFFKVIHEEYDDENRPTRSVVYEYITPTELVPNQRQQFQFDDDGNSTFILIENWDSNLQDWVPLKQENSTYIDGRLSMFFRQIESGGILVNFRRWMYSYNGAGAEIQKLLQQWDSNNEQWENLSRKITTYTVEGKIETQKTERYVSGNWQNRRLRTWTWNLDDMQPSISLFQRWDNTNQAWINDTRKTYNMNTSGLWSGSIVEKWDGSNQQWNNEMKETFTINQGSGFYTHAGDIWENNAWQRYIQNFYTFLGDQNPAVVRLWNESNIQYENYLRHRLIYNSNRLPQSRIGMQSWNEQSEDWENKNFTRRVTYFWTEDQNTATEEIELANQCMIPNPYYKGSLINCDIPITEKPLYLEVSNLLGQIVSKELIIDQVFPIKTSLNEGLYIARILEQNKVHHLEMIFVTQ
jgi:hypothetical protein